MGRALGLCTVDDENLASSVTEAKGLHQSLQARDWSRVRCCDPNDAFRVADAAAFPLGASSQDAYDRWTWERACNRTPARTLVGGLTAPPKLAMQHLRTSGETPGTVRVSVCFPRCARKTWNGWSGFHWIAAASFVLRLWARCVTEFTRGYCQDFDPGKMAKPTMCHLDLSRS